jgi:signal recognition particle GTPase
MSIILAKIFILANPQTWFTKSLRHDKMRPIMPMENESKRLLELPDPMPVETETSADIPQAAAEFRTMPKDAEDFGKVPQAAERKENHTLTVRETARIFETTGVARTERSIINWCQPNRQGIARLDSYFDPNERKYYITPQSVEAVIQEEIQRAKNTMEATSSETFENSVAHVKRSQNTVTAKSGDERKIQEMEREIMDLKIANRGKDYLIDQLKAERTGFFEKLQSANRTVGQMETKLLGLEGPSK